MRDQRLILFMLRPSMFSFAVCFGLVVVGLGAINWAFVTHSPVLYDYFFGPYGLVTALQHAPTTFSGFWQGLFIHKFSRGLLTYLFILIIAVVVFGLLEVASKLFGSVSSSVREVKRASLDFKLQLLREAAERTLIRVCVALAWFVYTMAFIKIILPFCISTSRFGIATISDWQHWWYIALGAVLLLVALHLHLVLARLFALRPRLFGGVHELLQAERTYPKI